MHLPVHLCPSKQDMQDTDVSPNRHSSNSTIRTSNSEIFPVSLDRLFPSFSVFTIKKNLPSYNYTQLYALFHTKRYFIPPGNWHLSSLRLLYSSNTPYTPLPSLDWTTLILCRRLWSLVHFQSHPPPDCLQSVPISLQCSGLMLKLRPQNSTLLEG